MDVELESERKNLFSCLLSVVSTYMNFCTPRWINETMWCRRNSFWQYAGW